MPFNNPVVGGTALTRTAINSPNYVPGSAGWSINRDGSAEFRSAVIRGEVDIGSAPGPRIVETTTIPATLIAASADFSWTAGTFRYVSSTDYVFEAVGTFVGVGGPFEVYAQGSYDTTHSVLFNVLLEGLNNSPFAYLYGSNAYNGSAITWIYRHGTVQIGDASQSAGSGNGTILIAIDGSLRVAPGAVFIAPQVIYTPDGTASETWHAVSFQNGWANLGGGFVTTQYRLVPSPAKNTQLVGTMAIGTKVDGTVVFNLPAAYRPTHTMNIPAVANATVAGGHSPGFVVNTNGDVTCFGVNVAGASDMEVNCLIPLDA